MSDTYTDPDLAQSSVLVSAVEWIQHLLTGSLALTIAVLAVAATGVMLFSGRLQLRRGATTILGCFILFWATTIANAFVALAEPVDHAPEASPPRPISLPEPAVPAAYDPYSGASAPVAPKSDDPFGW